MCATFEVQMTNGLIDRQLRFDKKDVYGNYVLTRNTPERNVDL